MIEDPGHTYGLAASVHPGTDGKHCRTLTVGGLAPVQVGVSIEDLQSAHEKQRQGEGVDPVGNTHDKRVSCVRVSSSRFGSGIERSVRVVSGHCAFLDYMSAERGAYCISHHP